jgi:hypothetical protein
MPRSSSYLFSFWFYLSGAASFARIKIADWKFATRTGAPFIALEGTSARRTFGDHVLDFTGASTRWDAIPTALLQYVNEVVHRSIFAPVGTPHRRYEQFRFGRGNRPKISGSRGKKSKQPARPEDTAHVELGFRNPAS